MHVQKAFSLIEYSKASSFSKVTDPSVRNCTFEYLSIMSLFALPTELLIMIFERVGADEFRARLELLAVYKSCSGSHGGELRFLLENY